MIKKIVIPFLLLIPLAGCVSDPRDTQCEKDKNYIITNPKAIDEFITLKNSGKIDGVYIEYAEIKKCDYVDCMIFSDKFKYVERYMVYKEKKGIYTIYRDYNLENPKCIEENWLKIKRKKNYCYIVEENKDNKINSDYHLFYDGRGLQKTTLKNVTKDEVLFEEVYQIYSVNYIGATGGGSCPYKYKNNPDYKFNSMTILN